MKIYIVGNTGTGKTAIAVFLARLYNLVNPNNKIYGNLHLKNIKNFIYSEFMFLPYSEIKKGNCLLIFDDFKAISELKGYSALLSILARKLNISCIFTVQYSKHLTKEMRELCHYEVRPSLIGNKLSNGNYDLETYCNLKFLLPINQDNYRLMDIVEFELIIPNIFKYVNEKHYNTNEIPQFLNEFTVIQEIAKFSNTYKDIFNNVKMYTQNRSLSKQLRKKICEIKNIEFLY